MSSAMQTILVSRPVAGLAMGSSSRSNQATPSNFLSISRQASNMRIRCMSTDQGEQTPEQSPPPPRKTNVSTNFSDVLAFSGPAPERINGRLATIGFVAALAVELSSGEDVFAQISNGGIPVFLATSAFLSLASLVPLFKGVSMETKVGDFFSSGAELWNGRFAMLCLVALAFTGYVKGGTLM